MFQRFWAVFSLSTSLLFTLMAPQAVASEFNGALCIINVDGHIVLSKEKITNTWSLPGGTILEGEPAEEAAIREVWEEAGLIVSVVRFLYGTDTAKIFECRSESDVVAYEERNEFGGHDLPIWFAPHFDIEVKRSMLVDPQAFDASLYRVPMHWKNVTKHFSKTASQPVILTANFIDQAPILHQFELNRLMELHQWLRTNSPEFYQSLMQVANVIAGLASPYFALLLVVFYYAAIGHKVGVRLVFAVCITMLMGLIAQYGFKWASPATFFYNAETSGNGQYSFPNLTAMLLCCVYLFLVEKKEVSQDKSESQQTVRIPVQVFLKLFPAIMLLFMLAQFFVGASFITDYIIGAALGCAIALHLQVVEEKRQIDLDKILSSSVIWLVLALVAGGAGMLWTTTVFSAWVAILLTLSVVVKWKAAGFDGLNGISLLFMTVAGCLLIICVKLFAPQVSDSSLNSLILTTISYPLVIIMALFMCLRNSADRKMD